MNHNNSLIERLITTVFGNVGQDLMNNLSRTVDRIYDFAYVRVFGLPFIVLGARQAGKTTLIEWLRRNVRTLGEFDPAPTAPGGDQVRAFSTHLGQDNIRLNPVRDVGGEYEMWDTDWVDLFREAKPRGIVFMIDHLDVLSHKDALNFAMNMIEEESSNRTLKAFLLLVNKSDLWEKETTLEKLMNTYGNEIKRLRQQADRLGYQVWIQSGSVMTGVGVDDAMKTFIEAIRPIGKS